MVFMPHYCFYLNLVYKLVSVYCFCTFTFYLSQQLREDPGGLVSICSTKDRKLFLSFLTEFSVETQTFKHSCWKASVVSRAWKENNAIASHLFFYCFSLRSPLLAVYFMLIKQTSFINCTSLDIVSSANMASAKNSHLLNVARPELLLSYSHVLCK